MQATLEMDPKSRTRLLGLDKPCFLLDQCGNTRLLLLANTCTLCHPVAPLLTVAILLPSLLFPYFSSTGSRSKPDPTYVIHIKDFIP